MTKPFDFDAALVRVPRWMFLLTVVGLPFAFRLGAVESGEGFLGGALLGYVNFRIIERAVNRISSEATGATGTERKPGAGRGAWLFFQFGICALLAFVIIRHSGVNLVAAFWGFLVCPSAVVLEILYELLTYGHS